MIVSGIAQNEMQIVCIFSELAWNSTIITGMINGPQDGNQNRHNESTTSPENGQRPIEMSLLTSASVFGARLEAPEPINERKSPEELRHFPYDHGNQNKPVGNKAELDGVRRIEEEFRAHIGSSNTDLLHNNLGSSNTDLAPPPPSPSMPKAERIHTGGTTPELHPLDSPSHVNVNEQEMEAQ